MEHLLSIYFDKILVFNFLEKCDQKGRPHKEVLEELIKGYIEEA